MPRRPAVTARRSTLFDRPREFVVGVVENSVRNAALQRLLEGHRLRVSTQPYVIASIGVDDNRLRLRFRDAPLLVSIDLPSGFATDVPDHLAWLFFNIERAVSDARGAAAVSAI